MVELNESEKFALSLFRLEGVGPNEHVNQHRLTKHVDFSVVNADYLNKGIQGLVAKELLAPGHHAGFLQLTADGYKRL